MNLYNLGWIAVWFEKGSFEGKWKKCIISRIRPQSQLMFRKCVGEHFSRDFIKRTPCSQTDYISFSAKRIKQQSSRALAKVEEAAGGPGSSLSPLPSAPTVPSRPPPTPAVCSLHSALQQSSSFLHPRLGQLDPAGFQSPHPRTSLAAVTRRKGRNSTTEVKATHSSFYHWRSR